MKELRVEEMMSTNGGGWKEAGQAFVGTLQIAKGGAEAIMSLYNPLLVERAAWDVSEGWDKIKKASGH
ncbi:hypothetical protein [Tepidibacter thalassicus]|uniref:Uncharacterized protein n=1 Tax=Tepidibacter thalassicus DSM 15285 TaxID=1123350 RepID=A0A1M5TYF1_9FIRM|nr:hypothetical protein [Tepidibacter thalassicus]SHH55630.1 hypothetical protein SAMN02744040_02335 [Tepidibacter thalassicus DSM 15285]